MDEVYIAHDVIVRPKLSRMPSRIIAEQVSYSFQYDRACVMSRSVTGVKPVLWGSDYPHLEGTFVYPDGRDLPSVTRLSLRNTFCDVAPEDTLRMVGQNAIDVYGLDAAALQGIARGIGAPTLDELATPIDAVPDGASVTAFRSGAGSWS